MIKNIIFDFGGVLLDWNPKYLYEPYFQDKAKAAWFLENICTYEWNTSADAGAPTAQITAERVAMFPEWEKEIRMYYGRWTEMMAGEFPKTAELVSELKEKGYPLYGLTNWSGETYVNVKDAYPSLKLFNGIVVSGIEKTKKPDPKLYKILFERYSLKPEECVFIDDSPANIETGESLGMTCIRFESVEQTREDLAKVLPE